MSVIIKVEGLGKKYILSHQRQSYYALRDVMADSVKRFGRKIIHPLASRRDPDPTHEEFWALKDVSFEINEGDRVGIIGRNGAGKSTLLKILSRITESTKGRVTLEGRVASLLEVGTGFHPELTGRENVYLNGAILGMSRAEIRRKFDEIVAFAEVEKFLDTPVKRYSSGMYVRLAFAVAAHLEPEILVVDEVLAVGDAQFQKKCLGKMEQVGREGRTVLFVSHNMAAVSKLCQQGIYLSAGMLHTAGPIADTVAAYLQASASDVDTQLSERKDRQGTGVAIFSSVAMLDSKLYKTNHVMCGQDITIRITLTSRVKGLTLNNPIIAIGVDDSTGQRVWHLSNESTGQHFPGIDIGKEFLDIRIPKLPLIPGVYTIVLFLSSNGTIIDWIQNATSFNVESGDFHGTGKLPPPGQGLFLADYSVGVTRHA